ncbi:UDP-N-acetylmuramoyl-tripeptide--D-alanyl-D-alanine ligase [Maricaulis sp. W15]|uniref:UDP-N-acetylmuramoyl-tripeptide--D-alanyl-D- alanine ligase n=1 Tax=Maricaulis sp. W15 TaxID=1772333 RepID=UPI000948B098|nr:UDP-N-acetylmuramoyl-tripeptide--D-alanyl-D-alanine ligase [Maricaulis sp. W15]OLF73925.1 UDP-N-acetylmuramoyl-tripeptide--D-alanyl-D-alanine ligase [Maricaulis sp. W15]
MSEEAKRPLWTSGQAMAATGGMLIGEPGWTATGVSIDTRTLEPGDLFVALQDARDGHDFVAAAMEKGAAACLVERGDTGVEPALLAKDALQALRALGTAARDRSSAIRVAVTGSVGKTSVKEAIAAVFRAAGPAHWSVKSYNNHWGVPLTLARMPRDSERAVFELGMNHAGEIRDLASLVRPHVALITRIAPAHLEHLGSVEAIADAKSEIFEGLEQDGVAIYPSDDALAERLARHAKHSCAAFMLDFGTDASAAIRIESFETGLDGSRGVANVLGIRAPFRLAATGAHWAWNAGAIFAACAGAGLDARDVAEALSGVGAEPGRGRAVRIALPGGGDFTLLDDAYNANPVSMAAAIEALGSASPTGAGRRIAVLGDMLELGPDENRLHAALADNLAAAGVDAVLPCGRRMKHLHDALPNNVRAGYAQDAGEGLEQVKSLVRPGDVVLIKGSNGSGLHKIASVLVDGTAFGLTEA